MAIQIDGDSGVSGVNGSATTPALQGTDSNTGIVFGTDEVQIATGGSTRATVNSSGRLGVGVTSPAAKLHVSDTSGDPHIRLTGSSGSSDIYATSDIFLQPNSSTAMTLKSGGNVGIGTTSPSHKCQIAGTLAVDSYNDTTKTITLRPGYEANANGGMGLVAKDHSGAAADGLGVYGTDGVSFHTASAGTFYEQMRITTGRNILFHKTTTAFGTAGIRAAGDNIGLLECTRSGGQPLAVNRLTNDGHLIQFYQNSNIEGSISVSGSTVSYNGGHLSRWSQLAGGAERTEILRGSVLSNLDEMCEWAHAAQDAVLYTEEDELPEGVSVGDVKTPAVDAYTEDNEQLNRMKVSDVEGDVNVAGVFQAWDDDDDTYTNDFYCAMTGDFIIRIAQGTTVARGDLLMSAGDGTAKPQDDDIVRSKTIAKVTSTTVSTTYSDGSYCVPCVLMAC